MRIHSLCTLFFVMGCSPMVTDDTTGQGGAGGETTTSTGGGGMGGVGGGGSGGCSSPLSGNGLPIVSRPSLECGENPEPLVGVDDGWLVFRVPATGRVERLEDFRLSAAHNLSLGCNLGPGVEHQLRWAIGQDEPTSEWTSWSQAFDVMETGYHDITLTLPNALARGADESVFIAVQYMAGGSFCPYMCPTNDPTLYTQSAPPNLMGGEWKALTLTPFHRTRSEVVVECASWGGVAAGSCAWDENVGLLVPPGENPSTHLAVRAVVEGPATVRGISASMYGIDGSPIVTENPELVWFLSPSGAEPKMVYKDISSLVVNDTIPDAPRSEAVVGLVDIDVPTGMTLFAGTKQHVYGNGNTTGVSVCVDGGYLGLAPFDPGDQVVFTPLFEPGPTVGVFLAP